MNTPLIHLENLHPKELISVSKYVEAIVRHISNAQREQGGESARAKGFTHPIRSIFLPCPQINQSSSNSALYCLVGRFFRDDLEPALRLPVRSVLIARRSVSRDVRLAVAVARSGGRARAGFGALVLPNGSGAVVRRRPVAVVAAHFDVVGDELADLQRTLAPRAAAAFGLAGSPGCRPYRAPRPRATHAGACTGSCRGSWQAAR